MNYKSHFLGLNIFILLLFNSCKVNKSLPFNQVIDFKVIKSFNANNHLSDTIKIDVDLTKNSGLNYKTKGLKGLYSWDNFIVNCKNATFSKGLLIIKERAKDKKVFFEIYDKNSPSMKDTFSFQPSYLTRIKLLKSTSFFCVDKKQSFDILCTFSNNKSISYHYLPKNMKLFEFRTSNLEINTLQKYSTVMPTNYFQQNYLDSLQMKVYWLPDTTINTTLIQKLKYNLEFEYFAQGNDGYNGRYGRSGQSGNSNQPNGIQGEFGENGENGKSGHNVELFIDKKNYNQDTLLEGYILNVSSQSKTFFKINYNKYSKLTINLKGGNGGNGGDGGNGGSGANETENSSSGSAASGGYGGNAGNGGDGGNIIVNAPKQLIPNIYIQNQGGKPGVIGKGGSRGYPGSQKKHIGIAILRFIVEGSRGLDGHEGREGRKGTIEWR